MFAVMDSTLSGLPDDFSEDDRVEADQLSDLIHKDLTGQYPKRPTAEAVERITKRVAYLQRQLANLHPDCGEAARLELVNDLRDARELLADYQAQLGKQN